MPRFFQYIAILVSVLSCQKNLTTLTLTTNPDHVSVKDDSGKLIGHSPIDLNLKKGTYTLILEKEGHKKKEVELTITANNEKLTVHETLMPTISKNSSQNTNSNNPIVCVENICWNNSFEKVVSYLEAKQVCENNNSRLPTKEEALKAFSSKLSTFRYTLPGFFRWTVTSYKKNDNLKYIIVVSNSNIRVADAKKEKHNFSCVNEKK